MNSLFFKGKVSYPDYELNFDLSLPGSGITALFGASGAGKSTLLRAVAGLVKPADGIIRVKEETWQYDKQAFAWFCLSGCPIVFASERYRQSSVRHEARQNRQKKHFTGKGD